MDKNQIIQTVEKAISTNTVGSSGLLKPEQEAKFITDLMDRKKMTSEVQWKQMTSDSSKMDFIEISKRNLRRVGELEKFTKEGTISTSDRVLTVAKTGFKVPFSYEVLRDTIARGNFEKQIMDMFNLQLGNDIEDLAINGHEAVQNTAADEPYYEASASNDDIAFLHTKDGWLRYFREASDKNYFVLPRVSNPDWADIFHNMLNAIPEEYSSETLKFYVNKKVDDDYRWRLAASRKGTVGDSILFGDQRLKFMGRDIVPVSCLPYGHILLTSPKNLGIGIQKGTMMIEDKRDIEDQSIIYVLSLKIGFQIAKGKAGVYAEMEDEA